MTNKKSDFRRFLPFWSELKGKQEDTGKLFMVKADQQN